MIPSVARGKTRAEYQAYLELSVNPLTLQPYTPDEITHLLTEAFPPSADPSVPAGSLSSLTQLRSLIQKLPLSPEQRVAADLVCEKIAVCTQGWEMKHHLAALRAIGVFDEKKEKGSKDEDEDKDSPPDKILDKIEEKLNKAKHITEDFLELYLLRLAKTADPSPQIAAQLVAFMDKKKALTKVIDLQGGDHLTEKQVKALMKLTPDERDLLMEGDPSDLPIDDQSSPVDLDDLADLSDGESS